MKLLSVAIPCYNSESYMSNCIESLLPGGEAVEILIVDDGSKDRTARIADDYAEKYPSIVRAIHQKNAGHGGAVNTGIKNASGLYFKVVDSDDWVDRKAYLEILSKLEELSKGSEKPDLFISNYVYDKVGAVRKKVIRYAGCFPENRLFGWQDIEHLKKGKYLLMHALIYRTQLLHDCGMKLPEHTFYVDNLYAYEPLPYVKTMYYMDLDLYHYYIGRGDQSVNEKVMIGRIDQQLRVNRRMVEVYSRGKYEEPHLKKYMFNYLDIISAISSIMLILEGTPEALQKKKDLYEFIRQENPAVYHELRHSLLGLGTRIPGKWGRKLTIFFYRITQKLYGFN